MSTSVPDQKIFPHATGEVAKTVEKHQEPQELIFYSGWFCPFVQRTWITLEEKGIPYQYKEVNPYMKEKHFLDINPKGLVPAFEYRGKALYESLVLCEFLEEAYPQSAPHLLPSDPYERGRARIWIDHISKSFVSSFFRLLQSQDEEKQQEILKELHKSLSTLCEQRKGPYFFGDDFSLVDVAIAPLAAREHIIIEHRGHRREDVSDTWKEWAELLESRPSVVRTLSDQEHYLEIYGRYLRDEAQSEAAKATRANPAHSVR